MRKLLGRGKDNILGEAKATHTSKAKPGIISLLLMGRHLQESKAQSWIAETWETNAVFLHTLHFSFFPLTVYYEHKVMVWNIPLVRWGHLSWLCLLPTSCVLSASFALWKHCSTITKTSLCYQPVSSRNPKHSPIPATRKKINSALGKINTLL